MPILLFSGKHHRVGIEFGSPNTFPMTINFIISFLDDLYLPIYLSIKQSECMYLSTPLSKQDVTQGRYFCKD